MSIQSNVNKALKAVEDYNAAVADLRKALKGKKPDAVGAALLPCVAKFYGVQIVVSTSNRNKGELALDSSAGKFAAAKKALQRLTADIVGKKNSRSETEIPEELLSAARTLAKRAGDYKNARSLASKALALAFSE